MLRNRYLFYIGLLTFISISLYLIYRYVEALSYRIGFISIIIAIISIILVFKSEELVHSLANASFRTAIGHIEDIRLELREAFYIVNDQGIIELQPKINTKRQINTWKCQTYTDEAIDILARCNIKHRNIRRFLNLINLYISEIYISNIDSLRTIMTTEETTHIISIYNRIYKLNKILRKRTLTKCKFNDRINESEGFIRTITMVEPDIEINSIFLKNYKAVISSFIEQEPDIIRWEIPFSLIIDIINMQYDIINSNRRSFFNIFHRYHP